MTSLLMHLRILCEGDVKVSTNRKILRGKLPAGRMVVVREVGGAYKATITEPFGRQSKRTFASEVACRRGLYSLDRSTDPRIPVPEAAGGAKPMPSTSKWIRMRPTDLRQPYQEIVDLYASGVSIVEIAARKQVSRSRVQRILMWREMVERDGITQQRTYDILARIIGGESRRRILADYQFSPQRLSQMVNYYGICVRQRRREAGRLCRD
jgi:uncharacterized protein (DUF433 family)